MTHAQVAQHNNPDSDAQVDNVTFAVLEEGHKTTSK